MKRSAFAIAASFCVAVIFVGLTLASHRVLAPARIDFTSDHLYTLSPSARAVTGRLTEPVELELVFSREVAAGFPAVRAHGERVRELLNEIAARSNGKVRIRETDPEPFSEEEDRITAAGISAAPADGGDPLYFGVLGRNTVDDVIAIPYLAPERDALLEYDLIRLVAQLDDPAPKRIAVLSSLPSLDGALGPEGEAFVIREMRRAYQVEYVDRGFLQLPKDADVLLIAHPPQLTDWQLYVIDQFLLTKGRALIALDPVSRSALASGDRNAPPASHLGRLEEAYGVKLAPEAVGDPAQALPVVVDIGGGRRVNQGQPLFIGARADRMSKSDPVTADLSRQVNFGVPGRFIVSLDPAAGRAFTPLISTSPAAGLVPFDIAAADPLPRAVNDALRPAGETVLAGRLAGRLASAFSAPPAPDLPEDPVLAGLAREEAAQQPPHVAASQTDAEIIFISDADLFEDPFYIDPASRTQVGANAAFILNALDNLVGDPALMALRSRAPALRPMERVDRLRADATQRLYAQQTALEGELAAAEARINELASQAQTDAAAGEIIRFRAQAAEIRGKLRGVEREFRRDIDGLAAGLEFWNVWLPPLLVAAVGIAMAVMRARSRGRAA